jgi:hypothetical protein
MRLNKIVPAMIALAQIGWANASIAQAPSAAPAGSPGGSVKPMYAPGARKGPPKETMHRNLQQMPPNIPVPIPPDAKFVTGYQSQYTGAKALTYVRMYSENPPAKLVDWYRQNLQAYGWAAKEKPAAKAGMLPTLTGTKGTVFCNINFEGPIGRLGKTTALMITFNEPR